jgi:hypothetical protein
MMRLCETFHIKSTWPSGGRNGKGKVKSQNRMKDCLIAHASEILIPNNTFETAVQEACADTLQQALKREEMVEILNTHDVLQSMTPTHMMQLCETFGIERDFSDYQRQLAAMKRALIAHAFMILTPGNEFDTAVKKACADSLDQINAAKSEKKRKAELDKENRIQFREVHNLNNAPEHNTGPVVYGYEIECIDEFTKSGSTLLVEGKTPVDLSLIMRLESNASLNLIEMKKNLKGIMQCAAKHKCTNPTNYIDPENQYNGSRSVRTFETGKNGGGMRSHDPRALRIKSLNAHLSQDKIEHEHYDALVEREKKVCSNMYILNNGGEGDVDYTRESTLSW